jgi:hypothetical protein
MQQKWSKHWSSRKFTFFRKKIWKSPKMG